MIIQAIALLDDLDKELNTYAMRVKEWYGWHFPEMAKIINDNLAYSRVILSAGMRSNCANTDLSDILPEEIEGAVKAAAEISMGTEITEEDLENIQALAEQVVGFTEYRQQLSSYLSARMQAIAPNLTALVGDLVGARLIAHAGSLMNLAKSPASTVQILGAEKALFRALKTKHDTPKYGLIYHASLIGQATGKNKGKIARMLATKTTLGLRVDALSDWGTAGEGSAKDEPTEEEKSAVGVQARAMLERRLRALEGKPLKPIGVAIGPNGQKIEQGQPQPGKFDLKEARKYNPDADGISPDAAPTMPNGEPSSSKKRKLVEDLDDEAIPKASSSKKAPKIAAEPDTSSGSSSDSDAAAGAEDEGDGKVITKTHLNGTAARVPEKLTGEAKVKAEKREAKTRKKDEKKARKQEKRSKKAEKLAKLAEGQARGMERAEKRKASGEVEGGERRKKKKKRGSEA
jgi:nucleolar protein 58